MQLGQRHNEQDLNVGVGRWGGRGWRCGRHKLMQKLVQVRFGQEVQLHCELKAAVFLSMLEYLVVRRRCSERRVVGEY